MARGKLSPKPQGDLMVKTMVTAEDMLPRRDSRRRNNQQEKPLAVASIEQSSSPNRDEIPDTSPTNYDNTQHPNVSPVSPTAIIPTSTVGDAQLNHGHPQAQTTILDLQSATATSSALPETFGFSISRKGRLVAVYGAKNVWLVSTEQLPKTYMRIFEVRRKPVSLDVLDDGSLLAVLSTPTKLDVYNLRAGDQTLPQKVKTVYLNNECSCVSLSPNGQVVAAGSKQGVEIISLAASAAEADKRAVLCDSMDSLIFSEDSRTLLATTMARSRKTSTIFTVHGGFDGPFTEDGDPIVIDVDKAWTTQVLFPDKCKRARQATLLPDGTTAQINELFAYDADQNTWGIYDLIACKFKESKVFLPERSQSSRIGMLESALPAVSPQANHVAVGVKRERCAEIWLYRLPESLQDGGDVDYRDDSDHTEQDSPQKPCICVQLPQDEDSKSQEIAALRWMHSGNPETERLIAVGSNIATTSPDGAIPEFTQASSGVIVVIDFSRSNPSGSSEAPPKRIVFDLDGVLPGEHLPDEDIDFEREVEIVRRRTVAQRMAADRAAANARRPSRGIGRSATTASRDSGRRSSNVPSVADDEMLQGEEILAAFEAPYDHTQPRSQASLSRAATVAARSQANRTHLRALPDRPLEYRRADGLREIPHESDADNWEPPPPPYTPRADPPGPNAVGVSIPSNYPQIRGGFTPASGPVMAIPAVPPLPVSMPRRLIAQQPPLPAVPTIPPQHLVSSQPSAPPVPIIPPQHVVPSQQIVSPQPVTPSRQQVVVTPQSSPQPPLQPRVSPPQLSPVQQRAVPPRRPVPAAAAAVVATPDASPITPPATTTVAPAPAGLNAPLPPVPGALQASNTFPLATAAPTPTRPPPQHVERPLGLGIAIQQPPPAPIMRSTTAPIPRPAAPQLSALTTDVPPVPTSNNMAGTTPRNTNRTTPRSRPLIPPSRPLIPPGVAIPQSEPGASPPPIPHRSAYLETVASTHPRPPSSRRAMSRSTTDQRVSVGPSFYMQDRRAVSTDSVNIQPRSSSALDHREGSQQHRRNLIGRMNTIHSIRSPSIASENDRFENRHVRHASGARRLQDPNSPLVQGKVSRSVKCVVM